MIAMSRNSKKYYVIMFIGQFFWGGNLLKSNGGVRKIFI